MWYNYMHCCAEGLALQCPSASDELINYIIIITMFVPFTLFHVDRHLKRLDNHSQYSVEQIGSDCTRIDLRASVFLKFSGGACPRTPLASSTSPAHLRFAQNIEQASPPDQKHLPTPLAYHKQNRHFQISMLNL